METFIKICMTMVLFGTVTFLGCFIFFPVAKEAPIAVAIIGVLSVVLAALGLIGALFGFIWS